ncbi:MAG TPA: Asp-tRNA(Asn)/Glu-tRNA(Gln) amidotransferase subunit GatC [bacterium]|nr:Asp-tRNA(Asn)/Glu-tRNA(Gln) amidotransferase subunit GatC [bacterium]
MTRRLSRPAVLCYHCTNLPFAQFAPPAEAPVSMIDDRTVTHVARLSRLELSAEEVAQFRAQLGEILAYIQTLNTLNLDGVPPAAQARPAADVLRDDAARPSLDQKEALANAPAVEDGYFVVPPVIAEE